MKVDGQCHCGAVAFDAEIDPSKVVVCHCTDCQMLSGTAFRVVAFTNEDAFVLRKGQPKVYVKTAQSGRPRAQGFCGDCGSAIYATGVEEGPKVYGLRVGVLNQRHELIPKRQIWRRSGHDWADALGALPAVPEQP